jgi:hypothetical protein
MGGKITMNHSFNIDIACKLGIEKAILLENIFWWLKKNILNKQNYFDDNYWTYNSSRAFYELFPYMSERSIARYLKSLEQDGYILIGNFNKARYDHTNWYAFTKKAYILFNFDINNVVLPICQNGESINNIIELNSSNIKPTNSVICQNGESTRQNGESFCQSGETIPDINTNINTDIKKEKEEQKEKTKSSNDDQLINDFFESVWKEYPCKKGKQNVSKTQKKALYKIKDELFRCIERYKKDPELKANKGFKPYQYGSTFFNKGYLDWMDKEFEQQKQEVNTVKKKYNFAN